MASTTPISWTEPIRNPVSGCRKISPRCRNSYAEKPLTRFGRRWGHLASIPITVTFHEHRPDEPKTRKRGRIVELGCELDGIIWNEVPDLDLVILGREEGGER